MVGFRAAGCSPALTSTRCFEWLVFQGEASETRTHCALALTLFGVLSMRVFPQVSREAEWKKARQSTRKAAAARTGGESLPQGKNQHWARVKFTERQDRQAVALNPFEIVLRHILQKYDREHQESLKTTPPLAEHMHRADSGHTQVGGDPAISAYENEPEHEQQEHSRGPVNGGVRFMEVSDNFVPFAANTGIVKKQSLVMQGAQDGTADLGTHPIVASGSGTPSTRRSGVLRETGAKCM